jgi:hypothetical protein
MRGLFRRFASYLIALVIALLGVAASFVFFLFAIYQGFETLLSPPLAALVTGFAILLVTIFLVAIAVSVARLRTRAEKDAVATGRAIGGLVMALIDGFRMGRRR